MSGLNNYTNLPGMMTQFVDGGLQLRQIAVAASTDSILILGTATDGPIMEPVAVDSSTAEVVFGKSVYQNGRPNGATLTEAFNQAYGEGCRDIRLMRISGSKATASIKAATVNDSTNVIQRQTLGVVGGNDSQVLTLSKKPIVLDSASLLSGLDTLPSTAITVDEVNGTVTVKAGTVQVGADLSVKYSYLPALSATPEDFTAVAAQTKFTVTKLPLGSPAPVVKVDGSTVAASTYTVSGKDFIMNAGMVGGEIVNISYSYAGSKLSAQENKGSDNKPWKAAASGLQEFDLSKKPVTDSLILYVNGLQVVPGSSYIVETTTTPSTIAIDKSKFAMGATVEVSYYYANTSSVTPSIEFSTYFGGTVYNDTSVGVTDIVADDGTILGKAITITKPIYFRHHLLEG